MRFVYGVERSKGVTRTLYYYNIRFGGVKSGSDYVIGRVTGNTNIRMRDL